MKTLKIVAVVILFLMSFSLPAQEAFEVEKIGKGQPVLLFPGFASTGEVWQGIKNDLSHNYECHIFTFAGFGDVAPIDFPWLSKVRAGIEDYVQHNDLQNAVLIGHSLGGTLGLWMASRQPENYSRIIVVDALPAMGALMIPDYESENIVYDSPYNQRLLEMNEEEFRTMALQMVASMSLNKEKHSKLAAWMTETDRKTFVYGFTDLLKLDLREDLSRIMVPVSILAATQPYGKETAEMNYIEQYKNLDSYTLRFAENSGHYIMYDQPEWFLKEIKSELEKQ